MDYGKSFWCAENELCHINALSLGNHVAADAYTFLYVTLTATRRGLPNAASCTSFPGSSTTRKTRGLRSDVAGPALVRRRSNCSSALGSSGTDRSTATRLMQQHLLPATRELSAAPRLPLLPSTAIHIHTPFTCPMEQDRDPSSPRHRVGELPRTAAAPCPTHPIPKPQERVMWDGA